VGYISSAAPRLQDTLSLPKLSDDKLKFVGH